MGAAGAHVLPAAGVIGVWILATLMGEQWYLVAALIHFRGDMYCGASFHCLWSLAHFKLGYFLIVNFNGSLCILDTSPLLDVCFADIFSHLWLVFWFPYPIFTEQKFLFYEAQLINYSVDPAFGVVSEKVSAKVLLGVL